MPSCRFSVRCRPLAIFFLLIRLPRRMASSPYSSYDSLFPRYSNADGGALDGGYADADGAASDCGYSSDGDISSMYCAYSLFKPRKREQWSPIPLPQPSAWRARTRRPSKPSMNGSEIDI